MPNEKEVFEYLEKLRESGVKNMYGAGHYVEREFNISAKDARTFLVNWMRSYSDDNS